MWRRLFSGSTRRGTKGLDKGDLLRLAMAVAVVFAGGITWRYSQTETVVQVETTLWSQQALQILGPLAL
ncbi:hypothetical protein [Pelagibius sp.]|uniref:hypothetical protein n=1 Tax=Pelagibius sp. TaxID=1931238 RepID=UPI003BAFD8D8